MLSDPGFSINPPVYLDPVESSFLMSKWRQLQNGGNVKIAFYLNGRMEENESFDCIK